MKLTLERDDGKIFTLKCEGLEITLDNLETACVILDDWNKEWTKDNEQTHG
jgi:hypothetical protein